MSAGVDLSVPIAIVRALAECDEPIDSEYSECKLCDEGRLYGGEIQHKSECPWRRSRDYVKELRESGWSVTS